MSVPSEMDVADMDDMINREVVEKVKMEDLVEEYLKLKDKVDFPAALSQLSMCSFVHSLYCCRIGEWCVLIKIENRLVCMDYTEQLLCFDFRDNTRDNLYFGSLSG